MKPCFFVSQCIFAFSRGPDDEPKLFVGRTPGTIVPARGVGHVMIFVWFFLYILLSLLDFIIFISHFVISISHFVIFISHFVIFISPYFYLVYCIVIFFLVLSLS